MIELLNTYGATFGAYALSLGILIYWLTTTIKEKNQIAEEYKELAKTYAEGFELIKKLLEDNAITEKDNASEVRTLLNNIHTALIKLVSRYDK